MIRITKLNRLQKIVKLTRLVKMLKLIKIIEYRNNKGVGSRQMTHQLLMVNPLANDAKIKPVYNNPIAPGARIKKVLPQEIKEEGSEVNSNYSEGYFSDGANQKELVKPKKKV